MTTPANYKKVFGARIGEHVLEKDTGAVRTITNEHSLIHIGYLFSLSSFDEAIADDGTMLVELITPADHEIHLKEAFAWTEGALAKAELIEAPTLTTGVTPVTPVNRKRIPPLVASSVVAKSNPTGISGGTALETVLFGGGGVGAASNSGQQILVLEWELKLSTTYLVRFTNLAGATKAGSMELFWYELPV